MEDKSKMSKKEDPKGSKKPEVNKSPGKSQVSISNDGADIRPK